MMDFLARASRMTMTLVGLGALLLCGTAMAQTTTTLSSATVQSITDDGYNGTQASMACTVIDASGIPSGDTLVSATVTTQLTHTWLGDLTAKLMSPDGSVLTLFSRPGFTEPADDGTGCCGDSSNLAAANPLTFDDSATNDPELMGGTLTGAQVVCLDDGFCSYFTNPGAAATPPASFADLAGEAASGNWTLCVGDSGGGDTGEISGWSITLVHEGAAVTEPPRLVPASSRWSLVLLGGLILAWVGFGLRKH